MQPSPDDDVLKVQSDCCRLFLYPHRLRVGSNKTPYDSPGMLTKNTGNTLDLFSVHSVQCTHPIKMFINMTVGETLLLVESVKSSKIITTII